MKSVVWSDLDAVQRQKALARASSVSSHALMDKVREIIDQVRRGGDAALSSLTARLDGIAEVNLKTSPQALAAADANVTPEVSTALDEAISRVRAFHKACAVDDVSVDLAGVRCERVARPIQTVGLYVPAGSAPLPSTTIMLGVPATLAQCPNVVICSPPGPDGQVDPTVRAVAYRLGISQVFAIGGAQAVAAMAYGTETIPRCHKIFGPGNAWVTQAKQQVSQDPQGASIDMPAGPSEVMVVADSGANPAFVASDLLSQAEHGPDSHVVLVVFDVETEKRVDAALSEQLALLPRAEVAQQALSHSVTVRIASREDALSVINTYAPEHLILQVDNPRQLLPGITAAGSVFVGPHTPESLGDYCSGTNHVLPTYGYASAYSGVSVDSFQIRMTVQEATAEGLERIGPTAVTLARVEGLEAHAQAVTLRLAALNQ